MTIQEEKSKTESTENQEIVEKPATTTEAVTPLTNTSEQEDKSEVSALAELGAFKKAAPTEEKKDAPAEEKKTEPEEYEIELSDKSPLTEKDLDKIVLLAEKYNWSKEQTDEYISEKEEVYSRGTNSLRDQAMKVIKAEKDKLMADPDFRGDRLVSSLKTIDLVVQKYGDPELEAYMKGPGGNSLALSKMLLKVGKLMEQDTVVGKGVGSKPSTEGTREGSYRNMYPQFFKE